METKQIIVIAGHDLNGESGAVAYDGTTEAELTHNLRETVVLMLEQMSQSTLSLNGTRVDVIEDNDRDKLLQTVRQVNKYPKAIGIDLHFNYNHPSASGVEVFVSPQTSEKNKQRATKLVHKVAQAMGLPIRKRVQTRDYMFSNESQHPRLAILDDTIPPMMLLEVCFLNQKDLTRYRANINEVAKAIAETLMS